MAAEYWRGCHSSCFLIHLCDMFPTAVLPSPQRKKNINASNTELLKLELGTVSITNEYFLRTLQITLQRYFLSRTHSEGCTVIETNKNENVKYPHTLQA